MNEYEVNCIMRVLAKFAFSRISSNPNLIQQRDNCGWTRIYECYQSLNNNAPDTMEQSEFFSKFGNIDYLSAASTVSRMNSNIKQHIVNCLLHMARYKPITPFMGTFFDLGDHEENIMLIEEIAMEAQIMTDNLRMIIKAEKDSLH